MQEMSWGVRLVTALGDYEATVEGDGQEWRIEKVCIRGTERYCGLKPFTSREIAVRVAARLIVEKVREDRLSLWQSVRSGEAYLSLKRTERTDWS